MDSKFTESKLIDSKLMDSKLTESKLIDSKLMDSKLIDSKLMDSKLTESSVIFEQLIDACNKNNIKQATILSKHIKSNLNNFKYNKKDKQNINNAFVIACYRGFENVALILLETKQVLSIDNSYRIHNKNALQWAIEHEMSAVILGIFNTSAINIVFKACNKKIKNITDDENYKLITILIKDPNIDLNATNSVNQTALIVACSNSLEKVALAILEVPGHGNPNHVSNQNNTALIIACSNKLKNVALAILEMPGKGNPNHVNNQNNTALIIACSNKLENVALAILGVPGHGNPNQVNTDKITALIFACNNKLENVALAILETPGYGNPNQVHNYNKIAWHYAKQNNMTKVVEKLELLFDPIVKLKFIDKIQTVDMNSKLIKKNAKGDNIFSGEFDELISEYNGLVFIIINPDKSHTYFLLTKEELQMILNEYFKHNPLFPCRNELNEIQFYNIKYIVGFDGYVKRDFIDDINKSNGISTKYFMLEPINIDGKKLMCKDSNYNDGQIYDIKAVNLVKTMSPSLSSTSSSKKTSPASKKSSSSKTRKSPK